MAIVLAWLAAALQLLATTDQVIDAAQPAALALTQPQSITVTLTSDRPVYRIGDDVRLKVSVRNSNSMRLYMPFGGPWGDAVLTIKDAAGALIQKSIEPEHPVATGSRTTTSIGPMETVPDTKYASGYSPSITDSDGFVSLRAWGYVLDKPGTYTVSALRFLGRDDAGKEHFVPSDTITIQITQ